MPFSDVQSRFVSGAGKEDTGNKGDSLKINGDENNHKTGGWENSGKEKNKKLIKDEEKVDVIGGK